jgi:hypothetical protein
MDTDRELELLRKIETLAIERYNLQKNLESAIKCLLIIGGQDAIDAFQAELDVAKVPNLGASVSTNKRTPV